MMNSLGSAIFNMPSGSLFAFPPNSKPGYMPPPAPGSSASAPPVLIPDHIYQAWLDPRVPITIATVYAVTVKSLNVYNRSTNKKPWAISQTRLFFAFVVLHNVFLAVYSAWTFWGMFGTLRRSVVSPMGPDGLAGTIDSFCRLNGPAGLGRAAYYSEEMDSWQSQEVGISLAEGLSRTSPGRIWTEGLAFYGWIFYLSKFYEVLDTFIILAKGKLSSTLQTYHHAGAMMCMWAGMRYMSPPIWMFVFYNSGIHAMMYTYYTLTAFKIKVPMFVKRTLTSMQITQFLVGASYAMLHSFVSYTIPVVVTVAQKTGGGASSSAASGSTNSETSPTAVAAGLIDNIKGILAGAVGAVASISSASPAAAAKSQAAAGSNSNDAGVTETVSYGERVVPCVTSTGETFAIWLNVLYLAPLTYLFVSFFITSYMRRSSAEAARYRKGTAARRESNVTLAEKAGWDAARGIEREVYGNGDSAVVVDENGPKLVAANGKAGTPKTAVANGNGKGSLRANGRKK